MSAKIMIDGKSHCVIIQYNSEIQPGRNSKNHIDAMTKAWLWRDILEERGVDVELIYHW